MAAHKWVFPIWLYLESSCIGTLVMHLLFAGRVLPYVMELRYVRLPVSNFSIFYIVFSMVLAMCKARRCILCTFSLFRLYSLYILLI